jgi:hypothetical protein
MELTLVAMTDDRYTSFGPYVASVTDPGSVAFQAERSDGTHAVSVGDGRVVEEAALGPGVAKVTSHPDVNRRGDLSFYGQVASGRPAVFITRDGRTRAYADGFDQVGPAGPTMNEDGAVAFRAERAPGVPGVHVIVDGAVHAIAEDGETFAEFFGLPLVDEAGRVVFRADRRLGVQGIYRVAHASGAVEPLVETGHELTSIAPFPCWAADDGVAFAGISTDGWAGVFIARDGQVTPVPGGDAFETHRGCLVSGATVVRIATPYGGSLGLFSGPDPVADRILGVGDPLEGSTVDALAANPVSVDGTGHLAVVVSLADGRGAVVRADLG